MKASVHAIVYAAVLGLASASLLTGAARFTEPYRTRNAAAERMRNILSVLQVPGEPQTASPEQLIEAYRTYVRQEDGGGLTRFVYHDPADGRVLAVAVPFEGRGVWGPIRGFLAMEPDLRTIRGVTFHEQEETPGLGGEIESPKFRGQFPGKTIQTALGQVGIRLVADPSGENEVHAITGATMTSEKVEQMLTRVARQIVEEQTQR